MVFVVIRFAKDMLLLLGGITSHNNSVTFLCHLLRSLNALGSIGKEMLCIMSLEKNKGTGVCSCNTWTVFHSFNLFIEEEYDTEMEPAGGELIQ